MKKQKNKEYIKEVIKEIMEDLGIFKELKEIKEAVTLGRSRQFPKALQFIIDSKTISRKELMSEFQSLRSGYYMEKFKSYVSDYNVKIMSLPCRGHPEIFIHCNPNSPLNKFIAAWETEGQNKKGILSKKFSKREWQKIKDFVKKIIKPLFPRIYIDDNVITWK